MAVNAPSTSGAGVTGDGDDYRINNDYQYPRYYVPAPLRTNIRRYGIEPGMARLGPYANQGLLRGWIYPIDVNTQDYLAAVGATSTSTMNTAITRAQAERDALAANDTAPTETVGTSTPPAGPSTTVLANTGDRATLPKKIRYREGKQFQFNPGSVEVAIEMTNAAPAETQQQGGTAGTEQIGGATTTLQLLFDRTIETFSATVGIKVLNGYNIDPIFRDIGVQKDLWDVYRIVLGGDKDYFRNVGRKLVNIDDITGAGGMKVQDGSVTDMTTRLFDLGISGASAWGRRIAVYYNPNLVVIGDVTSIGFTYAEFNANFVPIKAKLDLGLSILHTTSESGTDTFTGADQDPGSNTNPDGSTYTTTNPDTYTASDYNPPVRTTPGGQHYTV